MKEKGGERMESERREIEEKSDRAEREERRGGESKRFD